MTRKVETDALTQRWLEMLDALSEPFPVEEHDWRILSTAKNGAWVIYYVDVRSMMERLQRVCGCHFSFTMLPMPYEGLDGVNVRATLTIDVVAGGDSKTIVVEDFGWAVPNGANEPLKSAATDALRRVLSHIGIGRYLYHLPRVFIRGRQGDNGFQFDEHPLSALAKAMKAPPQTDVMFFPEKGNEAPSEDEPLGNGWDMTIAQFRDTYSVSLTDKQIRAFTRLVKPDDEESKRLLLGDPDKTIKQVLDKRLGVKR